MVPPDYDGISIELTNIIILIKFLLYDSYQMTDFL